MIELTERIGLGIDEAQRGVAETTARMLMIRRSAPSIGTVATADPATLERLEKGYEKRREALLTRFSFKVVASAIDSDGERLFVVPDHGDLLAPSFQFTLNPNATETFREVTDALSNVYDPWSIWATWVGSNPSLGGKSPGSFIASEELNADELFAVRSTLLNLLPNNQA